VQHAGRISRRGWLALFALIPAAIALAAASLPASAAAPAVQVARNQDGGGMSPREMPHYLLLEQALEKYRDLAARPELTGLPPLPRKSIKPGESWASMPMVRRLLMELGDLPASAATVVPPPMTSVTTPGAVPPASGATPAVKPEEVLDDNLVLALRHFQERHGLDTDGVLGPATWRALTTPMSTRVRQIEQTLESWRALPANPHPRAIFINIPRFRLYAVSGFEVTESQMLTIDVVVGRAVRNMRTPVFTADMTHVIFRPYWDVPRSIARNEILPAARRDLNYLARNQYELLDGAGRIVPASEAALDQLAAGSVRVRQRPGPGNALGAVKFMLPNSHNVYLHDTPSRTLFARSRRDFSHGCIRVADPAGLAEWVLQDNPAWDRERIEAAMAGTRPLRVDLAEPIRVYIVYGTAIAREDGSMLFLEDLYGLEKGG
jgi:murein L,D-transpeptidase YcbB/YkuD